VTTLALLGAGKLGEALLSGMLRAGQPPGQVLVTTRRPERARLLVDRYGVRAVTNQEAAAEAGVLLVTVKPQDIDVLLDELGPAIDPGTLVVSCVAGIPTTFYGKRLPDGTPVVRVMTNTPVLVDQAMSAISAGRYATEEHLDLVTGLLAPAGKVVRVPESQQDAVTALSGSGPAYFYFLVEAMTDAGILLGLPRTVAHDLIVQTALGAAIMLRDSGEHPVTLREAVTSPAGTTINAIRELEVHGVRAALIAAIEAARDRGRELGREHE
jgi:pyrroline-5-carboxylate reductase